MDFVALVGLFCEDVMVSRKQVRNRKHIPSVIKDMYDMFKHKFGITFPTQIFLDAIIKHKFGIPSD